MTARQFATAAGADVKWILNSAAILRRRVRHTPQESRWWGLVRLLTESLGLSLKTAAEMATASLDSEARTGQITVGGDPSRSTFVLVDLRRYQSVFLANLSRASLHETPRRRGRPPRRRAAGGAAASALRYGVDLGLLRSALRRTPAERLAMLEANSEFVIEMRERKH